MNNDKDIKAYAHKPEGYKIPEGYFSDSKAQIIKKREGKRYRSLKLKPIFAVAASVALLISIFLITPKEVVISSEDVLAYLEADIENLEEEDLIEFVFFEEETEWDELLDLDDEIIFNEL